jgi:ubiquitin carboxyl-terminal hydrolase 8
MSNYLEKYKNKGLTGLANLGNTCYINSCMQVLSHCYIFNEFINQITKDKVNNSDDSLLLLEWINLRNLMWSKNCIISPNRYINTIQKVSSNKNLELFSGYAQNDLPEFLYFIIDSFHNSIKREVKINISGKPHNDTDLLAKSCYKMIKNMYSKTYSELLNIFYGVHVSLIKDINKENVLSSSPEPYCLISLPIPNNKVSCSIYDCFDLYTQSELLEGENAWFNEKTNNKEDVYKSLLFWSLPEILIVDFKRFNNSNRKINTLIETPIDLFDLRKYVIGYDKDTYIYELFGITNHSGNCLGGHYTSYVKNANNKWYEFNDTNVKEISESKIITNKGYCYFYKKINLD